MKKKRFSLVRGKRIYRLILADSHQLFRRGLLSLLASESDLTLAAEVSSPGALMTALASPADFLIADVAMLEDADPSMIPMLRQRLSEMRALFLSQYDRPECLDLALKAGGRAFMLKSTPPPALLAAIRSVAAGREIPEFASTEDLKALANSERKTAKPDVLTSRELEILRLLAEGRTVREAAAELALSIKTVEAHKLNLMRKLNIHNRASLIEYAASKGYIATALPA